MGVISNQESHREQGRTPEQTDVTGRMRPILLVEDDRVDTMTVQRALKELHVARPLVYAQHGEQALEILEDTSHPLPWLILLDLNMPRMNGVEFLSVVKQDAQLCLLPVVVLTTSRDENDKAEAFRHSVAGYMVKPVDYDQFVETLRILDRYWTLSEQPEAALAREREATGRQPTAPAV